MVPKMIKGLSVPVGKQMGPGLMGPARPGLEQPMGKRPQDPMLAALRKRMGK